MTNQPTPDVPQNQQLLPDETITYSIPFLKGTFRKKKAKEFILTQYRVAVIDYENPIDNYSLPLEHIDDIIVYDTSRQSESGFSMVGTRQMYSAYFGRSKSKSMQFGSLIVLSYRYDDMYLKEIADIEGVSRLIWGHVKQRKAQLKQLDEQQQKEGLR